MVRERTDIILATEIIAECKTPQTVEKLCKNIYNNLYAKNYVRVYQILEILMKRGIVVPEFKNKCLYFQLDTSWLNNNGHQENKNETKTEKTIPYLKSIVKFLYENPREGITKQVLKNQFKKARSNDLERVISHLISKKAFLQMTNDGFKIDQNVIDFIYKQKWGQENKT